MSKATGLARVGRCEPVRACEQGLGDLSKPTAPAYFFVVKVMFVGVVNFGQIPKLRFVVVKNFRSCSIPTFGHLHSVKLTSIFQWQLILNLVTIE